MNGPGELFLTHPAAGHEKDPENGIAACASLDAACHR